ncbi:phosphatidylinositol-glycan biosynthesis class S protein-domain-containing protein [Crepidotus variabilis]|uniref:Phosphatidylinositol-glycan biosynthesis class S protein-domain-containing protein n=1 Tax=Crepidotus variabilis TaxID=179855 RepID=A0A9P6JS70_9AGAR|nr:phosphatidylinositol-glycan biosynthesis class S protein-domain-containing protein [Crepidotus variabilis]
MDSSPQPPPTSPRDPSKLFHQKDSLRRSIVAVYWTVIVLSIPLWWTTTSIQRLSLPFNGVREQAYRTLELPISICLDTTDSTFRKEVADLLARKVAENSSRWAGTAPSVKSITECAGTNDFYTIKNHNSSPYIDGRQLYFPLEEPNASSQLVDALASLLVPYTTSADPDRRVAQYSSRYRLAFSLLNEDATTGDGVMRWKVQEGLRAHIKPILKRLHALHNFTIESQVQFHAPLAFSPRQIEEVYAISPEDLTVFINSAEWTLSSSSSNDPVLHLVLFIPSSTRRPLHILTKDESISPSNAFIRPQWGGIIIHTPTSLTSTNELPSKDLDIIFATFASQLLGLLGVPQLPSTVQRAPSDLKASFSDWQLDALLRRRTLENAAGSQDTLLSIVKLVNQLEGMPVHEDVRDDVENALSFLTKMYDTSHSSLRQTFEFSARSFNLASRAFSNPGLLALLYFPTEHKYAVYTPLFATSGLPLFFAALREVKRWKESRLAKHKKA